MAVSQRSCARRGIAGVVAGVLIVIAITGAAASVSAQTGAEVPEWVEDFDPLGDVDPAPVDAPEEAELAVSEALEPITVEFPAPSEFEVPLDGSVTSDAAADDGPITVRPADELAGSSAGGNLQIEVLDHAAAERAGVSGVVFTLADAAGGSLGDLAADASADAAALPVEVEIDYSKFAGAHGGNYGDRLQLVALPACALASPRPADCATTGVPIETRNDLDGDVLVAEVGDLAALSSAVHAGAQPSPELAAAATAMPAPTGEAPFDTAGVVPAEPNTGVPAELDPYASEDPIDPSESATAEAQDDPAAAEATTAVSEDAVVIGVTAVATSTTTNFAPTPFSPTGQWQVSPGSGEFTYSYDMSAPAAPSGSAPSVSLGYSSGAVDGLSSSTNTQGPQAGVGWSDFAGSFIERAYEPCVLSVPATEDLCWKGYNGTISLNGISGPLVALDSEFRQWRLENDPGWRIERIGEPGEGEYWKVTATDGTQYFFGMHYQPDNGANTLSRWWVPVAADNTGEPCRGANDTWGWCPNMTWRWMLDYVVDPNGNTTTYYYDREYNRYRGAAGYSDGVQYVRSGQLLRIEYGGRQGSSAAAAGRVTFGWQWRCEPLGPDCVAPTNAPAQWYPDVPTDLICSAAPCEIQSPSFFSGRRYSHVLTEVRVGTEWRPVTQYNLIHAHHLHNPTDGKLYLHAIQQVGVSQGGLATYPSTTFEYTQLSNRDDVDAGTAEAMVHWRVNAVVNPFGGAISVAYGQNRPCEQTYRPDVWDQNVQDCFPQTVNDAGHRSVGVFNKYLTMHVFELPQFGSEPMVTSYTYEEDPAWAFDYGAFARYEHEWGWSLWRGYGTVTATTGATVTRTRVFRGMNDDPTWVVSGGNGCPCGDRVATVTSLDGTQTFDDSRALTGRTLEQASLGTLAGTTNASLQSTLYKYQITDSGVAQPIFLFDPIWAGLSSTTERVASAPNVFRERGSTITYNANFQPALTQELGWLDVQGDERCSITEYADNATVGMFVYPSGNMTTVGLCPAIDAIGQIPAASILRLSETYYDDSTALGTAPTRGNATWQRTKIDDTRWSETHTVFDALGRPTSVSDPNGATTTTVYTAAEAHLLPTSTVVTNQLGHSVTTTLLPEYGVPLTITDANGNLTSMSYDYHGRLSRVRLPTEQPYVSGKEPSWKYEYFTWEDKDHPPAVLTQQLTSEATSGTGVNFESSWMVFDGHLRERQTLTQSQVSGYSLVSETRYDSRGLVSETIAPEAVPGGPGPWILSPADGAEWANRTRNTYDALGRLVQEDWLQDSTVEHSTTQSYGVDTVTVTGPEGAQVRETADGLGRTVKVEEHESVGGSTWAASTYGYNLADDLLSVTDPAGNVTSYTYNMAGWRETQIDPDRGAAEFDYNTAGLQTRSLDAVGNEIHTIYDVLGRATERRSGSATGTLLASWSYDTIAKGQLTSSIRYDATGAWVSAVTGYDGRGRAVGTTTTVPAGLAGLSGDYTTTFTYDRADRVASTAYPAIGGLAAETVTTSYNNLGLATGTSGTSQYVSGVEYDSRSRISSISLGPLSSGVAQLARRWTYNADQQLAGSEFYTAANGVVADHELTYDEAGTPATVTTTLNGQSWHECFGYDDRNRLTEAYSVTYATNDAAADCASGTAGTGPQPLDEAYAYSIDGNMTSRTEDGVATNYAYRAPGQTYPHVPTAVGSDIYWWDDNGNLVYRNVDGVGETLTWDAEQNMTSVNGPDGATSFVYDPDGQRLLRQTPTERTMYVAGHEVTASLDGATVNAVRNYGFEGTPIATRSTSAGLQYLMTDESGSVELTVSAARAAAGSRTYDPYGSVRSEDGEEFATDRGFLGQVEDESTGLSYLNARYYDTNVGVFTSADPLYDTANIKTLNPYSYGANNPASYSDASGLSPSYIFGIETANIALRQQNEALIAHIGKLNAHITELQDVIRNQQNIITDLLTHVEALEAVIRDQQAVIQQLVDRVNYLVNVVNKQRAIIGALQAKVAEQQRIINWQRGIIDGQAMVILLQAIALGNYRRENGLLRGEVASLEWENGYQDAMLGFREDQHATDLGTIDDMQGTIDDLQADIDELAGYINGNAGTFGPRWDGDHLVFGDGDGGFDMGWSPSDVLGFVAPTTLGCLAGIAASAPLAAGVAATGAGAVAVGAVGCAIGVGVGYGIASQA